MPERADRAGGGPGPGPSQHRSCGRIGRAIGALFTVLLALSAANAAADVVSYQKGDGKGVVSETDDTTLREDNPTSNFETDVVCGVDRFSSQDHCALKFPNIFGNGANQIPLGSTIVSATLTLNVENDGANDGLSCPQVFQLTESWTESQATWNLRSTGVPWTNPGADGTTSHKPVAEGIVPCLVQFAFESVDVTTSVQNWSSGEANQGWVLIDQGPADDGVDFYSSEEVAFPARRPQLTVTYTPPPPLTYYRSAGTASGDLNVSGHTVQVSGTTATFFGAMPANVGVGDVLQYQVTGFWYLAFIAGRASDMVYSVRSATAGTPQAAVAGTPVSVFRAYGSLSNWQAQDENDALDDTVEDFDTSRDLVAANATMMVACYNDGPPMNDMVNVTGWFTAPANYVRIFTPVAGHQVGVSQRHTGVAGTGFRLTPVASGANYNIINLNISYIRIEGLEMDGSGLTNTQFARGINVVSGLVNVGDIRIDSCLIHDLHTTQNGYAFEGSMGIMDFHLSPAAGPPMIVTNNVVYDITSVVNVGHIAGIHIGSRATSYVYNNTVYGIINTGNACAPDCGPAWGIYSKASGGGTVDVIASNNYVGNVFAVNPNLWCYDTESGAGLTQSYNVSSDGTANGTGSQTGRNVYATYFQSLASGLEDFHLTGTSAALWTAPGTDLSASFVHDVDRQGRTVPWDVGADESDGTTAVKLQSFAAIPGDASVVLEWRTASELSNLGFHLYRGLSESGPWTRLTASLIPGLGSSAIGQAYAYRDRGLVNGTRYFYRLEDVDASSKTTSHGPVSAVPVLGAGGGAPGSEPPSGARGAKKKGPSAPSCPDWVVLAYGSMVGASASDALTCTRHGDPEAVSLAEVSRDARSATLELKTGGFYALREASGGVRIFVPGFDFAQDPQAQALPFRRALVDAIVGRRVQLGGVRALERVDFRGLVPAALGKAEMEVSRDGTVRARRRELRESMRESSRESMREALRDSSPAHGSSALARLLPSVFQGETKSAVVEISPLRFEAQRQQLTLARRVRVRLLFTGREPGEIGRGSQGRKQGRKEPPQAAPVSELLARLYTTGRGLHAVSFEQLFPGRSQGLASSQLRLERQGQANGLHVEPAGDLFGPGGVLFFHAGTTASSTDFSPETAWELVHTRDGVQMPLVPAAPSGDAVGSASTGTASFETNRTYQPGLLEAPELWLWEGVPSGTTRVKSFSLSGVELASSQTAALEVFLQGASESGNPVDHHVSVSLNGVLAGEAQFAGKKPYRISLSVPVSLLREGANDLSLTNVADTGVSSYVFLDRFTLAHPQTSSLAGGRFEGSWSEAGTATVSGVASPVALLDVTASPVPGTSPTTPVGSSGVSWLSGYEAVGGSLRFRAEAGHRYLAVSQEALLTPRVVTPVPSTLRDVQNQADYLLIAPRAFLAAAEPLIQRRADQGLETRAVAFEEIADAFGHGQPSAEAIQSFLGFAFHSWAQPSPRYVLLLGDSTYDPRSFLATSQPSPLPALWTRTSYLWTASDPQLAAVNGEDALPDMAIGRLPATTVAEAQALVAKLLAWEDSGQGLSGDALLVADNPDIAGDFEANVHDIAQSFLQGRGVSTLKLSQLGAATRPAILDALNSGLSLVSYVGHGGAAVWASENVWNSWDAANLQAQSQQPLLLTLNCLNGYFVAPAFNSLAESLLKVEGRGAIASFSPSGLSLDGPAHQYHRALMAELTQGQHERLGDALLAAQSAYAQTGLMPELLAIYHLLGDPAMRIQ